MIPTVEIKKIYPTKIWSEKDLCGTVHIKMQHEGMKEFDFVQIQYNYAYTSNAHQHELTQKILSLLGVEEQPVCQHDWHSARNPVIANGSICINCGALDPREPEELKND